MIKDLKEIVVNGFYLFSFVFVTSVILAMPITVMLIAAHYLDSNL
tara:strand:- start:7020 stop:7154 length:135 start_codon:yes stop_codon:yes gene_type:complete